MFTLYSKFPCELCCKLPFSNLSCSATALYEAWKPRNTPPRSVVQMISWSADFAKYRRFSHKNLSWTLLKLPKKKKKKKVYLLHMQFSSKRSSFVQTFCSQIKSAWKGMMGRVTATLHASQNSPLITQSVCSVALFQLKDVRRSGSSEKDL